MSCGPLSPKRRTRVGSGSRSVVAAEKLVAYAIGDRSEATCRRLWKAIEASYRSGHCFSDFWAAYQAVIPEEQHTAGGPETGQTAPVERWNTTVRQRLARFVRKTLYCS